jgi:hypothetical protein
MRKNLNTRLPALPLVRTPQAPNDARICAAYHKSKTKANYDCHHGARELKHVDFGDNCLIHQESKWSGSGFVVGKDTTNRTYLVSTGNGVQRRNRVHLMPVPETPNSVVPDIPNSQPQLRDSPVVLNTGNECRPAQFSPRVTRSATGLSIRKPAHYRED